MDRDISRDGARARAAIVDLVGFERCCKFGKYTASGGKCRTVEGKIDRSWTEKGLLDIGVYNMVYKI